MKKLVFATNNAHKLSEVRAILAHHFEIISLNDLKCFDDIPETATTLEGNALLKANYIFNKFGMDCISDDTGLEVEALGGEPGVISARYAGDDCVAENNMEKLLINLGNNTNRKAAFRTVIALILDGKTFTFEGKIDGNISVAPRGNSGFGYDPVFIPRGYNHSFAELDIAVKNNISHRALAVQELVNFLNASDR